MCIAKLFWLSHPSASVSLCQRRGPTTSIEFASVTLFFTCFHKLIVNFRECAPICTEPVYSVCLSFISLVVTLNVKKMFIVLS